jgi:ABC-2 type transport system ATP-binding protein
VALAFVNDPDIMFLDEPTTGLDPQARRSMWEVIENLRGMGKTVFLTTHYMEEAERLCDRIAVMDHGEIITLGRPQQMIEEHFKERAIQFKMTNYPSKETLDGLAGVTSIATEKRGNDDEEDIVLYSNNITATIASLMDTAAGMNSDVYDLFVRQASLEDVFLKLTGRRIRD